MPLKAITVYFDEKEFKELKKVKKDISWHDFILHLIKEDKEDKEKND